MGNRLVSDLGAIFGLRQYDIKKLDNLYAQILSEDGQEGDTDMCFLQTFALMINNAPITSNYGISYVDLPNPWTQLTLCLYTKATEQREGLFIATKQQLESLNAKRRERVQKEVFQKQLEEKCKLMGLKLEELPGSVRAAMEKVTLQTLFPKTKGKGRGKKAKTPKDNWEEMLNSSENLPMQELRNLLDNLRDENENLRVVTPYGAQEEPEEEDELFAESQPQQEDDEDDEDALQMIADFSVPDGVIHQ